MLPESRDYPLSEQVVHWIRWARRHKGLTLRDLAEHVEHVTIGTLSNIELGRHVPRPELAERLGRVLGAGLAGGELAEPALGVWARKAVGRDRELLPRFLEQQRHRNPESVLPLTAPPRSGRGRPMRAPLDRRGGGPSVLFSRNKEHEDEHSHALGKPQYILELPVFDEHADPGDPRTSEAFAIGHRFLDVRTFGDPLELQNAYMLRLSTETADRLGDPFRARDLVVLTREGVPGTRRELFHVRSARGDRFELANVMRRDDQLLIYSSHEIDSVRIVDWPEDMRQLAALLPARVIGHLHRMGV